MGAFCCSRWRKLPLFFCLNLTNGVLSPIKKNMPNQPDPNKVLVGVRTPRELAAVLTQEAQEQGLKLPGLIVRILQQYVGNPAARLSRFAKEDVEQERLAAQQEMGSRRSAMHVSRSIPSRHGGVELVTGGAQDPISDVVWQATMNSMAPGWRLQDEKDGFCMVSERVPGHAGVRYQEGEYVLYAHYWGAGQGADFSKPLKWRYGGSRSRGCWRASIYEPALALNLRPIYEGELAAYIRSGKDDALHKLAEKLRELIICLNAYHRRAQWCAAVQEEVQAAGWYAYAEEWRLLRCCRTVWDKQVGQVQLLAYEPVENESMRVEMQLASRSAGHLCTLLRAMGRRDLVSRVYNGRVILEEMEMSLLSSGAVDVQKNADRLLPRLTKWMGRVNATLERGLPLENFAALAVETANHDFASVCDLGVVIIRHGKVVKRLHHLVQPEGNAYEDKFTGWHGISAADTEQAPSFAEVWAQLAPTLRKLPLVVYSGGIVARLQAAFAKASLPSPEFSLLQNLLLARRTFPELPSHNIYDVAEHIGFPVTEQGALPKAEACAHIAMRLYASEA